MATGEVLRSEPSFSDWTRPDLQCYEVGGSSESLPNEECLQDETCLASPQICKRLFRGAATEGQKQSWAVNPAQLRRAVKRSFELLQADEKLKGHEFLDPPPKKRLWAVKHLVGQLAW
ncbi:hypothetical protein COCOBI_15-3560 [Coccomyxa sp. Obi]|nr:hypothetical protein COCOBI_15-3560 [Coccomyxa sp. Obi]